jgi:8-oxo-dGTP pyrophosphatase MutT (NUDIX family)
MIRPRETDGQASHAGGLVYRRQGVPQYLLVGAKDGSGEWVLPKGHIEPGEGEDETAIREVREETGVVAQLIGPLPSVEFVVGRERVRVRFFLMERMAQAAAAEAREIGWFSYPDALAALRHAESKSVLHAAHEILSAARPRDTLT